MTKEYKIKGMICSRCLKVLKTDLKANGVRVKEIELGRIVVEYDSTKVDSLIITKVLEENEFEVIHEKGEIRAEQTKKWIITYIWKTDLSINLSEFISKKMNLNYVSLSKNFSKQYGRTIERYALLLKIERTKEFIGNGKINFSEMTIALGYQNSSALSKQFKRETGLSMKEYKSLGIQDRIPLDRI